MKDKIVNPWKVLPSYDLHELCFKSGFTFEDAAKYCGVSSRTFKRWGTNPPLIALKLFSIISRGYLPDTDERWAEMRIDCEGYLWTSSGLKFSSGDLNAIFFERQIKHSLELKVKKLERNIEQLKKELELVNFYREPANDNVVVNTVKLKLVKESYIGNI